jgi:hypothetical protein
MTRIAKRCQLEIDGTFASAQEQSREGGRASFISLPSEGANLFFVAL